MAAKKCPKCGQEKDARGYDTHVKYCKGTLQNSSVQTEAKAEPKTEPAPVPVKTETETITIKQDYTEVPKLDILPAPEAEESPKEFIQKSETATDNGTEKIDFEGIDDVVISIIDSRFKKNNIDAFSEDEKERIHKYTNRVLSKYAYVFVKYADVINLGIALTFPFFARADQIVDAKKRNEAQKEVQKQVTPTTETKQETKTIGEQDRAMEEYKSLKKD